MTIVTSYAAIAAGSTLVAPDTASYWTTPGDLLRHVPEAPTRTPQYSLMFAGVQLLGAHGHSLLAVQFLLRGISVGVIVWLIAAESPLAGMIVGALLAVDPVGALASTTYLSESVYTSALMLVMGLMLAQLSRGERRIGRLFVSGLGLGVCLLVRPTSGALIAPIMVAYAISTNSVARTAAVAGGYSTIALSIALYQYFRTGFFTVVTVGLYVAFPLFIQHLFDQHNGAASQVVYEQLMSCDPNIDYLHVDLASSNEFVLRELLPCTLTLNGHDHNLAYQLYASAYREALVAHPLTSVSRLFAESLRFLGTSPTSYGDEIIILARTFNTSDFCSKPNGYDQRLTAFVCPVPMPDPIVQNRTEAILARMRGIYQPSVFAYSGLWFSDALNVSPELLGGAALLYLLVAFLIVRPAYRPTLIAAAAVITYNAAATAVGQVTLGRYVGPMAPFFLIIGGLVGATLFQDVVDMVNACDEARGVASRSRN